MTKDCVLYPGFSKAVSFVIGGVNIVREPTTFGSKSPDILIKKYRNRWGSKPLLGGMWAIYAILIRTIGESCVFSDGCT
jgi:hypothetical protein